MSDINGAQAPAESVVEPEAQVDLPNPISTEPAPAEKPKAEVPAKPVTSREALKKAAQQIEVDNKAPKANDKPDAGKDKEQQAKDAQNRADAGKTPPKDGDKPDAGRPQDAAQPAKPGDQQQSKPALPSHTAGDPPARFSPDAKTEWAAAPESVRAEVSRMERELTQGFQKHRESAEKFEGYRELDDIARKHGHSSGAAVFREYYLTEQLLQKDLIGGLDSICQKMNVSLRDVAAHVLNQPAEQQSSQQDATIRELKQTISRLEQQVGGVVQTHQQQALSTIDKEIASFKAEPAHTRFDELADDIAFFLETRCPGNLEEAYRMAERLNPATATDTNQAASSAAAKLAASSAAAADLSAQTEKGSKSISGAPDHGSNPTKRPPPKSTRESLRRAAAAVG